MDHIDEGLCTISTEVTDHLNFILVCEDRLDERNDLMWEEGVTDQTFPSGCVGVDMNGCARGCLGNKQRFIIMGTSHFLFSLGVMINRRRPLASGWLSRMPDLSPGDHGGASESA